jgi:hypothetical protein
MQILMETIMRISIHAEFYVFPPFIGYRYTMFICCFYAASTFSCNITMFCINHLLLFMINGAKAEYRVDSTYIGGNKNEFRTGNALTTAPPTIDD